MYSLSLADFKGIDDVEFRNIPANINEFSSLSIDSRTIKDGQVFWAIKGEQFDGHDFVEKALASGAIFAVIEKRFAENFSDLPLVVVPDTLLALQYAAYVHRNKFKIPVIAVTGSNGKTTLKEMLAQILQTDKKVLKTAGNLNNHIGCPLTLLQMSSEHQAAVIELGSNHPGEIEVLAIITNPTHAVISNVGQAHIEFFKSKEGVFKEKTTLFGSMGFGSNIFINMNDDWLCKYEAKNGQRIVRFAFDKDTDAAADNLRIANDGCAQFQLNGVTEISLKVPGIHNAYNALAASAVALDLGYSEQQIKDALESYRAFDKRMERIEINGAVIMNDCYNASPDSMIAAIETVKNINTGGERYFVLGDMFELGDAWFEAHKTVIERAMEINPAKIFLLGEMMRKVFDNIVGENIVVVDSNEDMAEKLGNLLKTGDLVLIKGSRGMKMENIISLMREV